MVECVQRWWNVGRQYPEVVEWHSSALDSSLIADSVILAYICELFNGHPRVVQILG